MRPRIDSTAVDRAFEDPRFQQAVASLENGHSDWFLEMASVTPVGETYTLASFGWVERDLTGEIDRDGRGGPYDPQTFAPAGQIESFAVFRVSDLCRPIYEAMAVPA